MQSGLESKQLGGLVVQDSELSAQMPQTTSTDFVSDLLQTIEEGANPFPYGQRGGFSQGGNALWDPFETDDPRHFRK